MRKLGPVALPAEGRIESYYINWDRGKRKVCGVGVSERSDVKDKHTEGIRGSLTGLSAFSAAIEQLYLDTTNANSLLISLMDLCSQAIG